MSTIQKESDLIIAGLHQQIQSFDDKISLIVKEKDLDYEDFNQKLIIKDQQVFQLE